MDAGDLRRSEIAVGVGLHVLRYASSGAGSSAPVVEVDVDRSSAGIVELVGDPRARSGVLAGVGSALVVRCSGEGGRLVVRAVPRVRGGSVDARIRLEPLGRFAGEAVSDVMPGALTQPPGVRAESGLRVLGHVSRRGDVLVGPGEWISGPTSPLPIEGLEIRDVPFGAGLEYQVLSGGRGGQWSPWASVGQFAGSRGRSRPLMGVRMRLQGDEGLLLRLQALFLGAPVVSRAGRAIEAVGLSLGDPLVGLSVALDGALPQVASRAVPSVSAGRTVPSVSSSSVRVFRAGGF